MKKRRIYPALLLGMLLLSLTGCGELAEIKDYVKEAVQSGEKITMGTFLNEDYPEKELEEEQTAYYYGYSTLTEEEQKVYRQFMKGLEEFQEEISVAFISEEQLEKIVNMVMIDHPEYFWTEGEFSYYQEAWSDGSGANMKILPVYLTTKEEAETINQQIEAKAQEWIGQVDPQADTYGKIKFVYETLIHQVKYDANSEQNQNIRSVFLGGSTVCMGYAKATQYLLNKMGIFCTLVTGDIVGEQNSAHAWNLVKIGENYYYVDTTWGNPGYLQPQEQGLDIFYSYLCCSEATLAPTHIANDKIPLPSCEDDSYNYYKNKGCWYDTYDREQIYEVLQGEIRPESHITEFRFASREAYDQAAADMVEGDLIVEAVQNCGTLAPGQQISWQTYYGGNDNLIVVAWK